MKRKTKIILIIVLVILLVVGAYFGIRYLASPSTTPPVSDTSTTTDVSDSTDQTDQDDEEDQEGQDGTEEETGVPVLLSDEEREVFDFWINPSTEEVSYITLSGNIYGAREGSDPEISTQGVSALNFIKQSPSGDFILTAFGDPKNPEWGIFDVIDEVWRPLPSSIDQATWDNENNLVVVRETSNQRMLEVVELQNGSVSEQSFGNDVIFNDFKIRDIKMNVVEGNRLMIHEKPASFYEGKLWEINLNESTITNLIEEESGLSINWSESLAFKFNSPDNFFILDHNIENALPVFFTTLPSKCGQGGDTVVCGVPQNRISTQNSLPESYLQKEFFTIDDLYRIDPDSLETNEIFRSGTEDIRIMDIKNPRVSNGNVYFLNRYNKGLYRVSF